jgi:hypothetical protein
MKSKVKEWFKESVWPVLQKQNMHVMHRDGLAEVHHGESEF